MLDELRRHRIKRRWDAIHAGTPVEGLRRGFMKKRYKFESLEEKQGEVGGEAAIKVVKSVAFR